MTDANELERCTAGTDTELGRIAHGQPRLIDYIRPRILFH